MNEDLIVGEIYTSFDTYISNNDNIFYMIGKHIGGHYACREGGLKNDTAEYIVPISSYQSYYRCSDWCYELKGRTFRVATDEEKYWFNACSSRGKFEDISNRKQIEENIKNDIKIFNYKPVIKDNYDII